MNTYMFSIHPKWCEKIFNGEKIIEVRKTAPKPPFKVVVYCMKDKNEEFERLLKAEVPPVKIGNTNKTGKCGMCGIKVKKLYPQKVGQVDFMICERCKMIMDM